MLNNLNFWEVGALALLALFIFGPERLPKVIGEGMRMLRSLRAMARNATDDLSRELGTEVRLEDLHPKTFIRKHLLSEEEERELRRPIEDLYRDVKQATADTNDYMSRPSQAPTPRYGDTAGYEQRPADQSSSYPQTGQSHPQSGGPSYPQSGPYQDGTDGRRYDADAT